MAVCQPSVNGEFSNGGKAIVVLTVLPRQVPNCCIPGGAISQAAKRDISVKEKCRIENRSLQMDTLSGIHLKTTPSVNQISSATRPLHLLYKGARLLGLNLLNSSLGLVKTSISKAARQWLRTTYLLRRNLAAEDSSRCQIPSMGGIARDQCILSVEQPSEEDSDTPGHSLRGPLTQRPTLAH